MVAGSGAVPARAGQPLTYDHMAARPRHSAPESVALDNAGNVFVAEANQDVTTTDDRIAKYDADGTFLDVIAGPGTALGSVANPMGIAIAPTGGHNIYVVENGSALTGGGDDRVSYFSPSGNYLGAWGAYGIGNGSFKDPQAIAIDSTGAVYVADAGNDRVQVFDSSGTWVASWVGVNNPSGIAVDSSDRVWITNGATVYRYGSNGVLQTSWASAGATGIGVDTDGNPWVTSITGVHEYSPAGTLLATVGSGEIHATVAAHGVAIASNAVYVADTGNHRIVRFALPPSSTSWPVPSVTGIATDGTTLFTADGTNVTPFAASGVAGTSWASNDAHSTAVDASGNVWVSSVADGVVREYDASGNLLATVGATILASPRGIAVSTGFLYVADTGNNRIVKFNATTGALVTQWAVTGGVTGVAVGGSTIYAASGNLVRPYSLVGTPQATWSSNGATDLTVDASGNVWVSSSDGVVREYTVGKVLIATIGSGTLSAPVGVAVMGGRVYVADTGNDQVVRFSFASFDTAWGKFPGAGVEDAARGDRCRQCQQRVRHQQVRGHDPEVRLERRLPHRVGSERKRERETWSILRPSPSLRRGWSMSQTPGTIGSRCSTRTASTRTQWGSFGTNASLKQMDSPSGIAMDASGDVYVADFGNDRIEKFGPGGAYISTWGILGTGDGQFSEPRGVAVDASGNVWVADSKNNRIQGFTSSGALPREMGRQRRGGGDRELRGREVQQAV